MSRTICKISRIQQFHELFDQSVTVGTGTICRHNADEGRIGFASLVDETARVGDELREEDVVTILGGLSPDVLPLAPLLAAALQMADDSNLELGTTIVVCGDCTVSRLMGEIAKWWTPERINIRANEDNDSVEPFSHVLHIADEHVQDSLTSMLSGAQSVSFVDFSGNPDAWNVMLESAPYWSRFVANARCQQPMTIDFYNDVHRKGATIVGRQMTCEKIYGPSSDLYAKEHLRRAVQILMNDSDSYRIASSIRAHSPA